MFRFFINHFLRVLYTCIIVEKIICVDINQYRLWVVPSISLRMIDDVCEIEYAAECESNSYYSNHSHMTALSHCNHGNRWM